MLIIIFARQILLLIMLILILMYDVQFAFEIFSYILNYMKVFNSH